MKNYYEILEVDRKASKEIIDKAYRTLVKKYHPDLKEHSEKTDAESKIKEINEAYDTLSDKEKRENYDKNLQNTYISIDEYNLLIEENKNLKIKLNDLENNILSKLNQKNNYSSNYYNTNTNNSYAQSNNSNYSSKKIYNNYTHNNINDNTYNNNIRNNNNTQKSYKNTFLKSIFLLLHNLFAIIYRYIFIFLMLFVILILIKKYFFNTVFNYFSFKDLLILTGILFFLFYTLKEK